MQKKISITRTHDTNGNSEEFTSNLHHTIYGNIETIKELNEKGLCTHWIQSTINEDGSRTIESEIFYEYYEDYELKCAFVLHGSCDSIFIVRDKNKTTEYNIATKAINFQKVFDDEGRIIHRETEYGETTYSYDNDLTIEHHKSKNKDVDQEFITVLNDGVNTYNDEDKIIYREQFEDGVSTFKTFYAYDGHGNLIYMKDVYITHVVETHFEYDSNDNLLRYWDSYGNNTVYEYDEKGNEIRFTNSEGTVESTYDENGRLIHSYNSNDDYEEWWEYDEQGNEILHKDNEGIERISEYDEYNNIIHEVHEDGYEQWTTYVYED